MHRGADLPLEEPGAPEVADKLNQAAFYFPSFGKNKGTYADGAAEGEGKAREKKKTEPQWRASEGGSRVTGDRKEIGSREISS